MDSETQRIIDQCVAASHAGSGRFGEQVMLLSQSGVESYHVDFRERASSYYAPGGTAYRVSIEPPLQTIAEAFDARALVAAIRGSQQGVLQYPEFMRRAMQAGVVAYTVWIAGRHVTYFGRRGETHVEQFPTTT
ncbi:MAG TPA: hypothetical protein VFZ61_10875 [Polyangiales bacterium]